MTRSNRTTRSLHHFSHGNNFNKRHLQNTKTNLQNISKPSIRRLARRGGVSRIANGIYDETRDILKDFLKDVVFYTLLMPIVIQ